MQKISEFFEQLTNVTKCKCGFLVTIKKEENGAREEGIVEEGKAAVANDEGVSVYCAICEDKFCSSCKEQPYHEGYTCETFKAYLKSFLVCRYCEVELIAGSKEAEEQVCDGGACRRLYSNQCLKVH